MVEKKQKNCTLAKHLNMAFVCSLIYTDVSTFIKLCIMKASLGGNACGLVLTNCNNIT